MVSRGNASMAGSSFAAGAISQELSAPRRAEGFTVEEKATAHLAFPNHKSNLTDAPIDS
jgi:hypothetical protein